MSRPFTVIGTVMLASMLIFNSVGTAAVITVSVICGVLAVIILPVGKNMCYSRHAAFILAVIFISGLSLTLKTALDYHTAAALADNGVHTVEGTVTSNPEQSSGTYYYTVKCSDIDGIPNDVNIRIKSPVYYSYRTGDTVTAEGVHIYRLSDYFKSSNVFIGAYGGDISFSEGKRPFIPNTVSDIRSFVRHRLNAGLSSEYAGICMGILLGDTSGIPSKTQMYFRYAGISHLFAVSGLHLTLWTGIIFTVFGKTRFSSEKLRAVISILFILFFMTLTGFSRSVIRAGVMLLAANLSVFVRRRSDSLNSLFASVTLMLLINPFNCVDISMILSFSACLGMIMLSVPINRLISEKTDRIRLKVLRLPLSAAVTAICISVCANAAILPVSILVYGYFSSSAPITNLFCVLPAEILMICSVIGILLPFGAGKAFFGISEFLCRYLIGTAKFFSSSKMSATSTDNAYLSAVMLILFIAFALFVIMHRKDAKSIGKAVAAAECVLLTIGIASTVKSSESKITVCDTGGTAVILNYGRGTAIAGCGGSYGERELINTVNEIRNISPDWLIIPQAGSTPDSFAKLLVSSFDIKNIASAGKSAVPEGYTGNVTVSDNCRITPDGNTEFSVLTREDMSCVRLVTKDVSCLITETPTADFSCIPDEWKTADLLVARGDLPEKLDLSGFSNIIVISQNTDRPYPGKVFVTADCGTLHFTKRKGVFA